MKEGNSGNFNVIQFNYEENQQTLIKTLTLISKMLTNKESIKETIIQI